MPINTVVRTTPFFHTKITNMINGYWLFYCFASVIFVLYCCFGGGGTVVDNQTVLSNMMS